VARAGVQRRNRRPFLRRPLHRRAGQALRRLVRDHPLRRGAFNDATVDHFFEGPYTDVPVKLYVASYGTIPFDEDGNLGATYLEPIEGVELCTGTIEKLTDAAGHLDWNSPVRTTCDTAWTTFATASASSDPVDTAQAPAGPPDTWVPVGLGVGITKGPEQPGSYVLVAEPMDEAFRRGDSWKVITPYVADAFIGFEVGDGMFLDEDFVPLDQIDVAGERTVHFVATLPLSGDTTLVTLETGSETSGMNQDEIALVRVGAPSGGLGQYMGTLQFSDTTSQKSTGSAAEKAAVDDLPLSVVETASPLAGVARVFDQNQAEVAQTPLSIYLIQIIDVRGLYQPVNGLYDRSGGSYVPRYKSENSEGRIYAYWVYDHSNPGLGHFPEEFEDKHFADVEVEILPLNRMVPLTFGIQWQYSDPDDPTNELMMEHSGCVVDPGDCNDEGTYVEPKPDDNSYFDIYDSWILPKLTDGSSDATYPIVETYASDGKMRAITQAHGDRSRIRFKTTNAGGDNFTITARLVPLVARRISIGPTDETGVMTVWRKIYLEDRWMADEERLPVQSIQPYLEYTFIEVHSPDEIPGSSGEAAAWDYLEPHPTWPGFADYVGPWTGEGSIGQFRNALSGEWKLAVAARNYSENTDYDPPPPPVEWEVFDDNILTIVDNVTLEAAVPLFEEVGSLVGRTVVINHGEPNAYLFEIADNTDTRITIRPDIRHLNPEDGSERWPAGVGLLFTPLGYGTEVTFKIPKTTLGEGAELGRTNAANGGLVVFGETIQRYYGEGSPAEVLKTLAHEIEHFFVNDHGSLKDNCGNPSLIESLSCIMHYRGGVLYYDGHFAVPDESGSQPCAAHIRALRRAWPVR